MLYFYIILVNCSRWDFLENWIKISWTEFFIMTTHLLIALNIDVSAWTIFEGALKFLWKNRNKNSNNFFWRKRILQKRITEKCESFVYWMEKAEVLPSASKVIQKLPYCSHDVVHAKFTCIFWILEEKITQYQKISGAFLHPRLS